MEWVYPSRSFHGVFWSLRNIYLGINQGSTIGIIGPNGAGKSTLLRLMSGISRPTEGSIHIQGSVASILEMGTGFHPEFTGRSNVYLNCALQGYTRAETDAMMDEIIAFSELEQFIDQPVRTFSTGMGLRLAFAVATSVDPDVIIIDEALSVGDEHFRNKCVSRLNRFKEQGKTIVMVSHDLATVRHFCNQIVLLDHGKMISCGAPDEVLDQYLDMVHRREDRVAPVETETLRWGSGEVRISSCRMLQDGVETTLLETGKETTIEFSFEVKSSIENVVFGFLLYRSDGTQIHGSNHYWGEQKRAFSFTGSRDSGTFSCTVPSWPLLSGNYYLSLCCYHQLDAFPQAIDHWEKAISFSVSERNNAQHGILSLETEWDFGTSANHHV